MAVPKKTPAKKVKSAFDKKIEEALNTWATVLFINRKKEDWRTSEAAAKALWGNNFEKVEQNNTNK